MGVLEWQKRKKKLGKMSRTQYLTLWGLCDQLTCQQHLLSSYCLQRVGRRQEQKWMGKKKREKKGKKVARKEGRKDPKRKRGKIVEYILIFQLTICHINSVEWLLLFTIRTLVRGRGELTSNHKNPKFPSNICNKLTYANINRKVLRK